MNKRILIVGDAVQQTGFARVVHNISWFLKDKWDLHILGVNYDGDPHPYPYPIYPALLGGDPFGIQRIEGLVKRLKPDLLFIINDPWNIPTYLQQLPRLNIPVVAYMPVDAPNQQAGAALNALTRAITYTEFGRKQLLLGGYLGRVNIIGHGVDTTMYHPMPKSEARKVLEMRGISDESFIVGNVNRNQPRKRLDLTVMYWTDWWLQAGKPTNAYLYLHAANKDIGYNILQLTKYFGVQNRLIVTDPNMRPSSLLEDKMKYIYNSFDVQVSTTLGEGWGLTTHEGMACGVPQLVPRYSALAEWAKGAVKYVSCTAFEATPQCINTIGGVPDRQEFIKALDELYNNPEERARLSDAGRERATEERFKWENIAEQFHQVFLETVLEKHEAPVGVGAGAQ